MKSKLEQFLYDHRHEFDEDEPASDSWKKLQFRLLTGNKRPIVNNLFLRSWLIAASMIGIVGLLVVLLLNSPKQVTDPLSALQTAQADGDLLNEINPAYAKEVYHFTQLIELKQNELKKLQQTDPVLYNQFINDITRLDSSYNALQKELPENPNREQLLEAMIQNLRIQTDLLNEQLMIIQKIKQSKNKIDETNVKSI